MERSPLDFLSRPRARRDRPLDCRQRCTLDQLSYSGSEPHIIVATRMAVKAPRGDIPTLR